MANIEFVVRQVREASLSYVTFSGTVKDAEGDLVRRKLFLIEYLRERVVDVTYSDATTGEYSLTAIGGTNDVFSVLVLGEDGENDVVKGSLQGDFT